jgi:hypothetical protein
MMVLLLVACAARTPPVVYPTAMPEPQEPPPAEPFEPAADECPEQRPLVPGSPPPFIQINDDDSIAATCRAQVVPESWYYELVVEADNVPYWSKVAHACYDARAADRIHGQAVADRWFVEADALAKENRSLRLSGPALFVGGVIVGTGVGIAAAKVSAL